MMIKLRRQSNVKADLNMTIAAESKTQAQQSFEQICVTVRIKADVRENKLASLCRLPQVLNALIKPIPITVTITKD